jgi:hypothetical protein
MISARLWMIDLAVSVAAGGAGIAAAWWLRRYTLLSARNLHPAAAAGVLGIVAAALLGWRAGEPVLLPLAAPWIAGASVAHRWRQSDLGAGEELRVSRALSSLDLGASTAAPRGGAAVPGLPGRTRP